MSKLFVAALIAVWSSFAYADVAQQFNQRFEITSNKKGERIIKDRTLFNDVGLGEFVGHIGEFFNGGAYVMPPVHSIEWSCKGAHYDIRNQVIRDYSEKVLKGMRKLDFNKIVNHRSFQEFLSRFDKLTHKLIYRPHLVTLSNMDNPTYFYHREVQEYLVKQLMEYIKSNIQIPGGVSLALYIGQRYEDFVRRKRLYHQNILLSYLMMADSKKLGLTQVDVQKAISSIFESRIKVGQFVIGSYLESRKAQADWTGYGRSKVFGLRGVAIQRWARYKDRFDKEIERIDPSFSLVQYQGEEIIINLGMQKGQFNWAPSFTYDADCPEYNFLKRFGFEIVDVGIHLLQLPVPDLVKSIYRAEYRTQIPSEGLLYGAAEISGQEELKADLARQAVNPFFK